MTGTDRTLNSLLEGGEDLIHTENLMVEAVQELIKDEIKNRIKTKLQENEELKSEFEEYVKVLMEAKMKEAYAYAMLTKTSADLGLELIPPEMKDKMNEKLREFMEKKMEEMMKER
ncbi:MAG: hypothetical protein KGY66_06885 [Candidatus Thermoplasmatota archaeon]|nr:hypothetical protein [Candidatus Thermoplasmatota archaeon]MBS3790625.1 hypothetical protein [Candidatus Thermoplasmatota archaeon]